MEEESDRLYLFKKQIKKLSNYRGSGTQLISVYIPAGYPIHEVSGKLREELSQASNIKSKSTKTNVSSALEKIINHLKVYNKTPKNGICIFAGNVSENPSKIDVELFSIEPINELKMNIYRCDSKFFLEPLIDMTESQEAYGIVVMDGKEATIAITKGTETKVVKTVTSTAHAKIRKGGQSAARYQRLIEGEIHQYHVRIGESMDKAFLEKGIKGVIVGGPGPTKEYFLKEKTFNYQIKILGMVDTGYTDEYGVREVIAKSGEILEQHAALKEKKIVDRFIKEVVTGGLATYGVKEVKEAIESKQAEHVLVSEDLSLRRILYICNQCKKEEEEFIGEHEQVEGKLCKSCNVSMQVEQDEQLNEYFIDLAKAQGIKVDVISTNSAEGNQFLQGFGGIGAFLRYKS
ncbi:MAG: peptide chain release factor aRF-1 [Candidatus ainarchaeum sp.]|nr:peptide chain release factor aRF-1 [Candidatus ainarchaeum sp.]